MLWATGVFVAAVLAVAARDGALRGRTSPDVLHRWSSTATTVSARPWRTVTSIPLTSGTRMTAGMCVVIVLLFGLAEWRVGWRAAVTAGIAGSILATLVCDVALAGATALGSMGASVAAHAPDFGPSAVTAAAAGALARTLTAPLAVATAAVTLNGLLLHHELADWEHLVAFVVGAAVVRR